MKISCEVIRDLLPLYADGVESAESRRLVEEHLAGCRDCARLLENMRRNETEVELKAEKADVLAKQKSFFKRRSAMIGSVIAGVLMIPVLVCLIVNLACGAGLTWFFIVLASLLVAASLSVVPLMAPRNKGLWTLLSFAVSLVMLLGICCLYTGGRWFFVAASASVFGLAVVFLPFAVRAKPVAEVLGKYKALTVMAADTALYGGMMVCIGLFVQSGDYFRIAMAVSVPVLSVAWVLFAVIRYAGHSGLVKAGICAVFCGGVVFFTDSLVARILGEARALPVFSPFVWNFATVDGNVKWITMITCVLVGAVLILCGVRGRKKK